jgi:hypothetical protein
MSGMWAQAQAKAHCLRFVDHLPAQVMIIYFRDFRPISHLEIDDEASGQKSGWPFECNSLTNGHHELEG